MEKRTPSDKEGSVEKLEHAKAGVAIYNEGVDTSGVDEKKLLRKLDLALIPWLSFLYLLSFLDRTSIGKCVFSFFLNFSSLILSYLSAKVRFAPSLMWI